MTEWWKRPRRISVCVDTPGWFDPFAERLVDTINQTDDEAILYRDANAVLVGNIAFYLSCMKLMPPSVLARNRLNIVVHASALPKGRGFSPVVWQVLEGADIIPVTMIEAAAGADTGPVLMTDAVHLAGHELNDEIREKLGKTIVDMCLRLIRADCPPVGTDQAGEPSWYPRRRPEDSRIDPSRTIAEQFDLLRVVDNDRYPAYFDHRGRRYVLRIAKMPVADRE